MARTYNAREMHSMLDEDDERENEDSDVELALEPAVRATTSLRSQPPPAKAVERMQIDVGKKPSNASTIAGQEKSDDEYGDVQTASPNGPASGFAHSKRCTNRSPMGHVDEDGGSSETSEEWPTLNVRKSLKGEFDALDGTVNEIQPGTKRHIFAEDSQDEGGFEVSTVGDTTLQNKSQVSLADVGTDFDVPVGDIYMGQADTAAVMATVDDKWSEQKETLMSIHRKHFPEWRFLLRMKINILLHGVGSKKDLLEEFRRKELSTEPTLVIDGFDPDCTIETVLKNFLEVMTEQQILSKDGSVELKDQLRELISERYDHFNVILHNIDGIGMRNSAAQKLLGGLADIPQVHLIASMDHPNLPLLWTQADLNRFKWVYYHTSTFADYIEFPIPDLSIREGKSTVALSSLRHVYQSLTANGKSVYREIVKYLVQESEENGASKVKVKEVKMPYRELYRICRAEFFVSSDVGLRKQLVEFYDHELLKSHRASDGLEYLQIPVSAESLKFFLESCE